MREDQPERFLENVNQTPGLGPKGDCWEWTGYRSRGYGTVPRRQLLANKERRAHRYSYTLFVGPIPAGKLVRHLCNNRICVNPKHLAAGTMVENYQDAVEAGTAPFGERNGWSKYTTAFVLEVRQLFASGMTQKEIGLKFNLHKTVVFDIVRRRRWRHV